MPTAGLVIDDRECCKTTDQQARETRGDQTLNLLTTTIVAPPSNASKWQMGFNSAFKGIKRLLDVWTRTDEQVAELHVS